MNALLNYLVHVGDAISQLINTALLFGDPNESISGRSYRMQDKIQWNALMCVINFLLSPFESDHCKKAYDADVKRAKKLLETL